jgi:DNA-binding transcriptional ArsR family regulator
MVAATLQEQARALGDPTRHEIFRYIADAGRPVDVAELTAHLGLNHNAIRQHLAKLVHAELVTCPFATAAVVDPDAVCALHLGIALGVADSTDGRLVVDELEPRDPRRANCRLRVHLERGPAS